MNAITPTRREVLSVVFKRWRLLAAVLVGAAVLMTIISYIVPQYYEADAKVLIGSGREFQTRTQAGDGQVLAPTITKQEVINSELEILDSTDLIAAVINAIGLEKVYPKIADDPPSDMRPIDAAVKRFIEKDLKVDTAPMSEVITLSYLNEDRDIAIQTLATLIKLYQTKHAVVFGENQAGFLDQQIKGYDSDLDVLTRKITDFRQKTGLFDVNAQRTQLIQDRAAVADQLRDVESRSVDAHGRIDYYQGRLRVLSPLVVEGDVPGESVETAKSKLLDLTTQLQALRQRYATDVKPIQDLKEQIQSVQAFIDGKTVSNHKIWKQRDPAYDDATLKLQTAQADAASTDAQVALQSRNLQDLDAKLSALEDGSRVLEAMERDHTMLDDLARTTRTRYEDARSNEQMDRLDVVSVNVLEQPDSPTKTAKPKHWLFALIGLALGIAGDGAILFYALILRESLITAESAERLLGYKVLCVVPLRSEGVA